METAHAPNRQSDILPLINQLKFDPVKSETANRAYNSAANMTTSALVSPTNMYPGPPPPYSYPSGTPTSSHPISGLISPPESRRTSDDQDQPNLPPQQRQSLPSILEALGAPGVSAPSYQPQPTAPAPAPMPNPFSAPSNSIPRSQPFEPPSNLQRTSPPQPIHPQHRSYIRNESAPSNLPPPPNQYAEPSRHQSMPSVHSSQPLPPQRMQSTYVEQQRYENDPRSFESNRMNGYPPQPPQPNHYGGYQPSQMPMAPAPTYPNQYPLQRPYQNSRYGLEHAEEHSKYGEPASARKTYAPVVKRHLDTFEIEISLAEISATSNDLAQFSAHYHRLAQENQRSAQTPERMPTLAEVDNMLQLSEKQNSALQRMRQAVTEQQHIHADQMARDQGKGIDYDGDEGSMYSEDMKGNGYGGSDAKKRRGRAAPPGRCHSCNRAETPEWRRGPDGARTLCNACGLHYAKLTRKMGSKNNGQLGGSSSLRPKSMGSNSPL